MTTPIQSWQDGQRVTVNSLLKNPRVLPRRVLSLLENQFLMDSVLRNGGSAPGGVVAYWQSEPLFMDDDPAIKEEWGEYKIGTTSEGVPQMVMAINRGLGILISEEMRRREQMDRVNKMIGRVKNTMIRTWDKVMRDALLTNASVPFINASGTDDGWFADDANIRKDILEAKVVVNEAEADTVQAENFLEFNADTMICSYQTANQIIMDDNFQKVYIGDLADENLQYTGKLPNKILDLNVLRARTWPDDVVWIGERGTVGFRADERPLQSTPLRENPDREVWRSNTSRITAIGIDEPKAGVLIKNIQGA